MRGVGFEHEIAIAAPLARVFAELAEPVRFLGLQPLLTSVREIAAGEGARAFEAMERVRLLGPLSMLSWLRVELRPDAAAGRIAFATHARLGVRLAGAFSLCSDGGYTRVRHSVELHCSRWLRGFVLPRAMRAQEALLANLKKRLESYAG
ncbi:MAG: SRPBCC family protein [Myxococcota bacterium]|nr:SRPBCC family protein [Myxococcota bacterium]